MKRVKKQAKVLEETAFSKALHYKRLTQKALNKVKISAKLSGREKEIAEDFLSMAQNYFNDACYFLEQKKTLTALTAFSYAHAWLDAGVRAGVFQARDRKLFTLRY